MVIYGEACHGDILQVLIDRAPTTLYWLLDMHGLGQVFL